MIDFSKITSYLQVFGLAIFFFFASLYAMAQKLSFEQLSSNQTILLFSGFAVISVLLIVMLAWIFVNQPTTKNKKKNQPTKEISTWKKWLKGLFAIIIAICTLFIMIFMFDFIPNENVSNIYYETFDKNEYPTSWVEGEQNEAISKIKSGYYILKVIGNVPISRRIDITENFNYSLVSDSSNFQIELNIKKNEGVLGKNDGYGMELRGNKKNSIFYSFFINDNQEYAIQVYEHSSVKHDSITWKSSKSIKVNDFNILKVKCLKNKFSFYINGEEVQKDIELAELGNEIGFGTAERTAIQVDYLKLSKIDK
jgi:hypothetical protein